MATEGRRAPALDPIRRSNPRQQPGGGMLGMLSVCDECLIVSGEISDISGAEADHSCFFGFFFHFNPFFFLIRRRGGRRAAEARGRRMDSETR